MSSRISNNQILINKNLSKALQSNVYIFDPNNIPVGPFFVVFRIPKFSTYTQFNSFLNRKESPFSQTKDFTFSDSKIHFAVANDFKLEEKSGLVKENESNFDWFTSTVKITEILRIDNKVIITDSNWKVLPLWISFDWKYFDEEFIKKKLIEIVAED